MALTITGIIIAKNEEDVIARCVKSLKKVCSEVLVILDKETDDKTEAVAKRAGAIVIRTKKTGFTPLRNEGLKKAQGDWVLYVDADEELSDGLTTELKKFKNTKEMSWYAIPRKNIIFGKTFKHTGQWPDYVKRFYERSALKKWEGKLHEEPDVKGKMGYLKNPLIHHQNRTLSDMVTKTNKWSEIEASLMYNAQHPPMNIRRFVSAMFREFWLRFVKQKAFLDGPEGIVYGLYQVYSRFISYAKLWEMQIKAVS